MNTQTISLPSDAIARLAVAIAKLTGPRFVGVTYRSKESGELARHTLILGASYAELVTKSIESLTLSNGPALGGDMLATRSHLKAVKATDAGTAERKAANAQLAAFQASIGAERAASAELAISLYDTLAAINAGTENEAYTKAGLYETLCPGLKVSRADGTFELVGLSHSKRVIEAGTFKAVNSSAKTIAKDKLRTSLPIGKFRTLSLDVGALHSVRIGGNDVDVSE